MKAVFAKIFVTLGIFFTFLILIAAYFYVTDPMNLKPMIFGTDSGPQQNSERQGGAEGEFQLSEAQKQALINAGIDPAKVPSEVTASQEACFVAALGATRVAEIKGGAVPGGTEFIKAKSCI